MEAGWRTPLDMETTPVVGFDGDELLSRFLHYLFPVRPRQGRMSAVWPVDEGGRG